VERCDVLVQIVDARNPLLYRCPDLEDYVREVNPLKRCLLLINKADYLTHAQRGVWARHLRALGVRFVYFSARQEQLGLEEMDRRQVGQLPGARAEAAAAPTQLPLPSARLRPAVAAAARQTAPRWDILEDDDDDDDDDEGGGGEEADGQGGAQAEGGWEEAEADEARDSGEPSPSFSRGMARSAIAGGGDFRGAHAEPLGAAPIQAAAALSADDPARIFSRDELLDFFATEYADLPRGVLGSSVEAAAKKRAEKAARDREVARRERREELARRRELNERLIDAGLGAHVRFGDEADVVGAGIDSDGDSLEEDEEDERPPPLQIGMVGYPNVGKSSTINALTGATAMRHGSQRVAVASTPGKTKHFQTITLDDDITLCDW
jgi:large subunit GTPase 1